MTDQPRDDAGRFVSPGFGEIAAAAAELGAPYPSDMAKIAGPGAWDAVAAGADPREIVRDILRDKPAYFEGEGGTYGSEPAPQPSHGSADQGARPIPRARDDRRGSPPTLAEEIADRMFNRER